MMRDLRGSWLPSRTFLRIAVVFLIAMAALALGAELRGRSVVAAQRMTLTEIGRDLLFPGVATSVRVIAYDDLRAQAMPGVEVTAEVVQEIAQEPRVTIAIPIVTTNEEGSAQLEIVVPPGTPSGPYRLVVRGELGDDMSELNVPVRVASAERGAMVAVDKPRYQPGQTIHMRGLVLGPDRRPAADSEVTFTVLDSRGTLVSEQKRKTSPFGIAAAELPLASKVNFGDYTVRLDSTAGVQERTVVVSSYTLPKFDVSIVLDDRDLPDAPLTGRVRASYVFGEPVVGADVEVEGVEYSGTKVTVAGKTDAEGMLPFTLSTPIAAMREISAEVSGAGIGLQSAALALSEATAEHAEEQLSVEVVPELRELVRGVDNAIYFVVTDHRSRPVAATLRGVANEPFTITSSELGVAKLELEPRAFVSQVDVEVAVEDVAGRWGYVAQPVPVTADDGAFRLRTDRAAYASGESVRLSVRSSLPGALYVDLVDAQRTLASTEIAIVAGRGEGEIRVPEDASGLLSLRGFRKRGPFRFSKNQRRIFVSQDAQLDVSMHFAQESYRPGEAITLDVLVKGQDGQPTKAALSLAGIDSAVLRSYDAPPGSEIEQITGAGRLVESRVTDASPTLLPLLERTDATNEERDAQRAVLAAVDLEPLVAQELFTATAVHNGRGGEARRVDKRWAWESDRADALRMACAALLALGAIWLLLMIRNAWSIAVRVRFEGLKPRVLRAWTRLPLGTWLSAVALTALFAQVAAWRSTVVFGIWVVLWATAGAMLWNAAGHLSAARSLRRLAWSTCGMHILTHAVGVAALGGLYAGEERLLIAGAGALMVLTGATVGAAWVARLRGGVTGIAAWAAQLVVLGLAMVGGAGGAVALTKATPDAMDADRLTQMEQERLTEEHASGEGGTGTRAKGEEGSMGTPARYGVTGEADATRDPLARTPARVREYFPETLLWRPEVVTDAEGRAKVELELADSITTWNVSASAVDMKGRLGSASTTVRGFQPFFAEVEVPRHLTVGDRVSIPVAVFNYLEREQVVELELTTSEGLDVTGGATQRLRVAPGVSASAIFAAVATEVGANEVVVTATGEDVADVIKRPVTIVVDQHRVVTVRNGAAQGTQELSFDIPKIASAEGQALRLKLYPGMFSQIAEGLRGVFNKPYGCFEQTSSTTYPSVLALSFMRRTRRADAGLEKTAMQFIDMGYQRLLSFEVAGGGFSLYGRAPANVVLTAYGLMQFTDMAALRSVDTKMVERTRAWLMANQNADGRWDTKKGAIRMTAYVAWALAESGISKEKLSAALQQIASTTGTDPDDPYVLALRANALLVGGRPRDAQGPLDRLIHLRDAETRAWTAKGRTQLYSGGRAAAEETTALAVLALLRSKRHGGVANEALAWLGERRTANGVWHSTSATVAAMRALLEQTRAVSSVASDLRIDVNGEDAGKIVVDAADTAYAVAELGEKMREGTNRVVLRGSDKGELQYQLVSSYLVPWDAAPRPASSPLALELELDKTSLSPGEELSVDATVVWSGKEPIRMPMIEIGVPPSMEVVSADLDALQEANKIELWGRSARHVVLYLPPLNGSHHVTFRLRSRYPAEVKLPSSRAYDYYDPDITSEVAPISLRVR